MSKTNLKLTTTCNFDMKNYLEECIKLRPTTLIMDDIKWKYMVRSTLRGKNILLLGPTGCGKTLAAKTVATVIGKTDKFFYFNLGATQDARSALIGNTPAELFLRSPALSRQFVHPMQLFFWMKFLGHITMV